MTKWSVVACDQYTSQPEYWQEVEKLLGKEPSSYYITLPEIYLHGEDKEKLIASINQKMAEYLRENLLIPQKPGFILIDRKTSHAKSRKGLIVALDLEQYDYNKGSQTLIRATEGTVLERLPPRIKIRENAPLESPHIMVLIDDPKKTVIEPLFKKKLPKVYDFELMMGGGHLKGYAINDEDFIKDIAENLADLADSKTFEKKYSLSGKGTLLYAIGDGNHSLATAKAIWTSLKEKAPNQSAIMNHPARYALVELVNIHDPGLKFEPIHRVLFNVNIEEMFQEMKLFFSQQKSKFSFEYCQSQLEMNLKLKPSKYDPTHLISFCSGKKYGIITIRNPKFNLEVGTLQGFLDQYLKSHPNIKIDYVHGDEVVESLGSQPGNAGFFLPVMDKNDLFKTVILDGTLPRKTFSMGEADEKRFYLECRKIVP